ncbi:DUF3306 domain-containing protein [Ramlibacter sp. AN1015]|uniref:DUF3306 domain-containing protein n=1 Tax=Ramlibacter sp. AN1015 TaxID=3133428 RepID=UPI0030C115D3
MADGFLGRWSRRKLDIREGKPVEADPPAAPAAADPPAGMPAPVAFTPDEARLVRRGDPEGAGGADAAQEPASSASTERPLPPSLDDVQALTADSDFRRFVASDVSPEVKNAAVKKLFADPHFNVMDGLDVYIDDYSKPDPMPESMLRQLASAEFLGLFREKEEAAEAAPAAARDAADNPALQSVAQSQPPAGDDPRDRSPNTTATGPTGPDETAPEGGGPAPEYPSHHADPDLRLQQDHAPGPEGPGQGTR